MITFVPAIPPECLEQSSAWVELRERVQVFDPPEYRPRTHFPQYVPGQYSLEGFRHGKTGL